MSRMKTFFIYFLMVVICYFGSNTLIYATIDNTYKDISNYQNIDMNKISINIDEAKSTSVNGYIKGTIKNNTNSKIKNEYIQIDFYSARDVKMGTKYLKIENIDSKSTIDFDIKFKFSNVIYCVISNINSI